MPKPLPGMLPVAVMISCCAVWPNRKVWEIFDLRHDFLRAAENFTLRVFAFLAVFSDNGRQAHRQQAGDEMDLGIMFDEAYLIRLQSIAFDHSSEHGCGLLGDSHMQINRSRGWLRHDQTYLFLQGAPSLCFICNLTQI
jgi:hypothetical protein